MDLWASRVETALRTGALTHKASFVSGSRALVGYKPDSGLNIPQDLDQPMGPQEPRKDQFMDHRLPTSWAGGDRDFYVSITGLKAKGLFSFLVFLRHAVPSKIQAERADGILYVGVKKIAGIQHTLTAWESEAHMKRYIYSGAHLLALKAFRKIATGKTFGFPSRTLPTFDQAHEIWKEKGREYQ